MQYSSHVQVDLSALHHNVRTLTGFLSPGAKLCAVIKADAYGSGAPVIAQRLEQWGVPWLAVYDLAQAEPVLAATRRARVLVFVPTFELPEELIAPAKAGRLHLAVHGLEQMEKLRTIARKIGAPLPVHVEVDTGMSRGGQPPAAAEGLVAEIIAAPELILAGVFTHFSSSDDDDQTRTEQQEKIFDRWVEQCGLPSSAIQHLANTWATLASRRHHHAMVRVGLGLWGYPSGGTWALAEANGLRLQPVVRWVSRLVHIKQIPGGMDVGYNHWFRTQRPTRVGIVPAGYADGYPLLLTNRGIVRVGPELHPAPVIGRINMDQLIVDITDVPKANLGDEVELYSNDPSAPNALHKLATLAQSHSYEMLCRISPRVPRQYIEDAPGL